MKKSTKIAYLLAGLSFLLFYITYGYFLLSTCTLHHYSEIYFSETMKTVLNVEEALMVIFSVIWGFTPLTDRERAIGLRLAILVLYQK